MKNDALQNLFEAFPQMKIAISEYVSRFMYYFCSEETFHVAESISIAFNIFNRKFGRAERGKLKGTMGTRSHESKIMKVIT